MSKKLIIIMVLILAMSASLDCQADKEQKINTWPMPTYMLENLQYMKMIYEYEFNRKVDEYIRILTTQFKDYKDMPKDNVIFDLQNGIFLQRDQYQKAQAENQKRIQDAINTDKAKEKKDNGLV